MENNFINKIQELQGFSLQPSEQIWQEIEHNLDDKRKKRIVGWWWSVPAIMLIFGAAFWMMNEKKTTQEKANIIASINTTTSNIGDERLHQKNNIEQHNKIQELQTNNATKNSSLNELQNSIITQKKVKQQLKSGSIANQKNIEELGTVIIMKRNAVKALQLNDNLIDQQIIKHTNDLSENKIQDVAIIATDSLLQEPIEVAVIVKNELAKTDIKKADVFKFKTNKKFNWSLTLGGGTNYVSRNNILGQGETYVMYNTNLASTVGSIANPLSNVSSLSLPKTGFHFAIGVNVDYPFSKKISFQSGLKYKYLENKLSVSKSQLINNYYTTGNDVQYKDKLHLMELPININYCISPSSKNKIFLVAGVNMSYALRLNWLYVKNANQYYEDNASEMNKLFFGLQTGASINFNNKFSLSLLAQKNITAVQKTASKYYLQQIDFQLNIPFKSFKK